MQYSRTLIGLTANTTDSPHGGVLEMENTMSKKVIDKEHRVTLNTVRSLIAAFEDECVVNYRSIMLNNLLEHYKNASESDTARYTNRAREALVIFVGNLSSSL